MAMYDDASKLPKFHVGMKFEQWDRKMRVYLGSKRIDHVWEETNAPGEPPDRLPKATTEATFISKVKISAAYCDIIGITPRLADSAVDEDVLDLWEEAVSNNREEIVRHKKKVETWPLDCKVVSSWVRISCEENADTQRALVDVPVGDERELWSCIEKLKTGYGGEACDSRVDDLYKLVFMFFQSGDTAEQHVRKFAELIARLRRPETEGGFGETIKVTDLGKIFFTRNLAPFASFSSVTETLAQLPEESDLAQVYSTFTLAKKNNGAIVLQNRELQNAVAGLLKGALGSNLEKRGKGKYNKYTRKDLGGAAPGEGILALLTGGAQNQESQHQGGKGGERAPQGSCYRCWQFGHIARDCSNTPHPKSRDAQREAKGKGGQLWAGRTQNSAALVGQVSEDASEASAGNVAYEQIQAAMEFAQHNSLAFADYVHKNGDSKVSSLGGVAEYTHCYANFELSDAEKQKNLKRPLQVKPVKKVKGKGSDIESIVDSGCGHHMGPLEEVDARVLDKQAVTGQGVLTADANSPPLPVEMMGTLQGKCKAEKGHYKDVEFKFRGVRGLRKWLWSVAEAVRAGGVVHFEPESKGGSWIQLSGSAERLPIEFVNQEYFRLPIRQHHEPKLSVRQMQEVNFRTHVVSAHLHHRILAETKKRQLVRNMAYYPNVNFGTDETCITQKGQKAPFVGSEAVWRPKLVGALTRMDCKKIPKDLAKHSKIKYVLVAKDAKSRNVRRYYLQSTKCLHQWVFRYRNYLSRMGHKMRHLMADGEFSTQSLQALAGTDPPFDYSFSNPNCQSQNGMAEADIKRWDKGVRCILDNAMKDPKSKVTYQLFPYASLCLEQIENATFNSAAPEQTGFEAMTGVQPDMSVWQVPLCRIWFYIYPELRENVPFAARRAEGIFCGLNEDIRGYQIYNIATRRLITRRYEDCVIREPSEIFDYADTISEFNQACADGAIDITDAERGALEEVDPQAENLDDIAEGNELPDHDTETAEALGPGDTYDEVSSGSSSDSDSSGQSESSSESSSDSGSEQTAVSEQDAAREARAARRRARQQSAMQGQSAPTLLHANWGVMQQYLVDEEAPVRLKQLPQQVVAQTGQRLQQVVTVPVGDTASKERDRQRELMEAMNTALSECPAQYDVGACPRSWDKALGSELAAEWRVADNVEFERMKDFEAFNEVAESDVRAQGHKIGHLLRVLRVKPDELRVRWAYDEARAGGDPDVETYASVLRLQTSRLLNMKACNKGQRVLRGDMTSAFLHVVAKEVFYTFYPPKHPLAGTGKVMQWVKLLYGKGSAPRGLRQDVKSTLLALGFEEQTGVDECLYVHEQRGIDFGCFVDDVEATASNKQLEWLKRQFALRYEIKWLGYTEKNCAESSEKSKTYVGIRSEIDPVRKILTQDQTELIRKMASGEEFDASRPRYSPPSDRVFRQLRVGEKVEAKFHRQYRRRVGMLSHLAMCTGVDVAFAAVCAARRLNDPVPECMEYVNEALQFVFSTAEDKLIFHCEHELGSTLLMSSDSSLANAENGKSTGGWVSLCGGAAWAWMIETLRLVVLSSTEAELCVSASACKEVVYQERLFTAFGLKFPNQYPVLVDNMSAIAIACGPEVNFQRTKHIDMKYHYQRQLVLEGVVRIQHQATGQQFSDILTKNLGKKLHKRHREVLFGRQPVVIDSHKLPSSQKAYVRRHNDEVERKLQQRQLQAEFQKAEKLGVQQAALGKIVAVLLALAT